MSGTSVIEKCGEGDCEINIANNFVIRDFKKVANDHANGKFVKIDIENIPAKLIIYPSGVNIASKGYLSVFLEYLDPKDITIDATYSILNREGDKTSIRSTGEYDPSSVGKNWGFRKFISHDDLFAADNDLLLNGNLTLSVDLKINSKTLKKRSVEYPYVSMGVMYESLFEDPDRFGADFVIECKDEEEVRCHRNIMAATFDYFENMSSAPMIERETKRVKWKDIDIETCKIVLKYIYTGQLNYSDVSLELYQLAARLFLTELKAKCSRYLTRTLNVNNCIDRIIWADRLEDKDLKEKAAEIIEQNKKKLQKDVRKALKANASLALDLFFKDIDEDED